MSARGPRGGSGENKFSVGDSLELMTPQGNINFTLEHMENAKGEAMPIAPGDGYTVWLPVPQDLELNYALLMRNFSGKPRVIPTVSD